MEKFFKDIITFITETFELWHFLVLLGFILIFVGLMIIVPNLYKHKKNYINQLISNLDNLEHISIDVLNKTIYHFSTINASAPIKEQLQAYLMRYDEKNRAALNRWISTLTNKNDIDNVFFEITTYSKEKKSYVKEVFSLKSINPEKNMVHIDKYISSLKNKKNPECPHIKADYEIERCFFKLKKNSNTFIGLITFYSTEIIKDQKTYHLDRISRQHIIDIILPFCDNNHLITQLKNGDLGLIILNYSSKKDKFIKNIIEHLNKYYAISKAENEKFHITAYINKGSQINYNECIKKDRTLSNHLLDIENYQNNIFFYNDGNEYPTKSKSIAIEKIKRLLSKEDVQIQINPFLKSKDAKLSFYSYEMISETFSHLELAKICSTSNKDIDYLRLYLKKTLETIELNKENCLSKDIMLTIDSHLIFHLMDLLPEFKMAPCHFIFNIIEDEYLNQNRSEVYNCLKEISELGFDLCITLASKNIPYESIINFADYILLDQDVIHTLKKNKGNMILTTFFNNMISQKKVLIASHVPDWSTYETLICKKVSIFNGRFLENQSQDTLEINRRILTKMKEIYKKYY